MNTMNLSSVETLLMGNSVEAPFREIAKKVVEGKRISNDDAILLYEKADLSYVAMLANFIREKRHGDNTYFNRNFHLEPTNYCVFDCKFCSYSRLLRDKDEDTTWFYSKEEMLEIVDKYQDQPVTEVHMVGGVHPKFNLDFFCDVISAIREKRPDLHVKAFTPVEYEYMFRKAKLSYKEGFQRLIDAGLGSMPGGGAEIFDEGIRKQICEDKCTSQQWLDIHEAAHELGLQSNATMLYGHIESYAHRVDHMDRLRTLQDKTGGFNTFIPLKFRNKNNQMEDVAESTTVEDLKNYAISRIYMDNFDHIKAYWPMIGRSTAQLSLSYGVDDIDGTIDDTTKIYSMAGSEEQTPSLTTQELVEMITIVGRTPIERDTLYGVIKKYDENSFTEQPA